MNLKCKEADSASCPHGLTICCATCGEKDTCHMVCGMVDNAPAGFNALEECDYAESVNNELAEFESAVPAAIRQITDLILAKQKMDQQEKELKAKLVKAMETFGVKSFENELIRLTYVAPTTRSSIDSARLKKDHPDIAAQYTKTSNVSACVKVAVK
jgi:hypothetical protein